MENNPLQGLNEFAQEINKNNVEKGFYNAPKNIGEMLCLVHSEVSEALEADRKNHFAVKSHNLSDIDISDLSDSHTKMYFAQEFEVAIKNSFEDELADIMIRGRCQGTSHIQFVERFGNSPDT